MSIYADVITAQELIDGCFDPETGEVYEEQENTAVELKKEVLALGLETLCKVRANMKADIDVFKAEEKRIADRRKAKEKSLERLEKYIMVIYEQANQQKVQAGTFTVSVKMSEAVKLNDDFVDLECRFGKMEYTPDKKAIKEALKAGEKIDGAEMQVNFNLQVR